jgi:PTH1 family peptidyl-tRNA hydrolase
MLLLVGLGNPGEKYAKNRHNIGFQIIDAIADHFHFEPEKKKFQGLAREGVLESKEGRTKALLLKPETFYNEAGKSVAAAAQFFKIDPADIIVFHDELDLAPGKLKVKTGGGAAGNNGLKSITSHLGPDFRRVRVGIGHPGEKSRVTAHVLGDISKADRADWADDMIDACARAAGLFAAHNEPDAKFMSAVALHTQPRRDEKKSKAKASAQENNRKLEAGKTPAPKAVEIKSDAERQLDDKKKESPFSALKGLFSKEN